MLTDIHSWACVILSLSVGLLVGICYAATAAAENQVATDQELEKTEVLNPPEQTYEPAKKPDLAAAARRIVELTNDLRKQEKSEKIKLNPDLSKAAQYFADYMARTTRYGHKADGKSPDERAKRFEYQPCIIAENIAYEFNSSGFSTEELASSFFKGWKASPGHHKNMVDPDVVESGVAVAQSESGYFFAVQEFGRPESLSVEFQVSNRSETTVLYKMDGQAFELEPRVTRTHRACRLRDLAFRWFDGGTPDQAVEPRDGDRIVITQDGRRLKLQRE